MLTARTITRTFIITKVSSLYFVSQISHIVQHLAESTMGVLVSRPDKAPKASYHPLVQELRQWVMTTRERRQNFEYAVTTARSFNVAEMEDIRSLTDWFNFLHFLQHWVPTESVDANEIFNRFSKLYFVLDQHSVFHYQSPVLPNNSTKLSFISDWIVRFNVAFGQFMDTPESLTPEALASYAASPKYLLSEYLPPRGGWRSFNEFFARHYKPGYRPIAAIEDPSVIVSPADFTFSHQLSISPDSTITAKSITWKISELMAGSPYADCFKDGTFMHGYNATSDYHRIHAPVGGKVLEARTMSGQHYALIETREVPVESNTSNGLVSGEKKTTLVKRRIFMTPNEPGYQFVQTRGWIVFDTEIGKVALVPVGMAVVSSVIITAEEGVTLRKGEEVGYFQFGGSDVVILFENKRDIELDAKAGQHFKMGVRMGTAVERD